MRRRERLEGVIARLGGMLRAVHTAPRLVLAAHPTAERWDALWIVGGRVADWGELPEPDELAERTEAVLSAPPPAGVRPDDVDEVRIVAAWLAEHEPPALPLDPRPRGRPADLGRFVRAGHGPATTSRTQPGRRHRALRRFEAGLGVGAVAERLGGGAAAAAEGDRPAIVLEVVAVAVGVDHRDRPGDLVGAVLAHLDLDWCPSRELRPALVSGVA